MQYYFAAILAFAGMLLLFDYRRQKRLDADPAQHNLTSLLIAAVTIQPGASPRIVSEELDRVAKGRADRRVRLNHAVMLVRASATPQLYSSVLEIARKL